MRLESVPWTRPVVVYFTPELPLGICPKPTAVKD
jgi:hypothetical protein